MAVHITSHSNESEYQQNMESVTEKGLAAKQAAVVTEEVPSAENPELRPGHKIHYGAAVVDVLISLLPLYFVVFGLLANARDGTLATSFRNTAILKMATLNPTLFPIVFALIMAKFLKAFATWRLERGTTVGFMQHVLGSRSLVSSIMTPIRLRMTTYLVPLLVLMWILNPIGGQTSLRVVSKQSNITDLATPFHYLDVLRSDFTGSAAITDVINNNFNAALSSPVSAKNGSQDLYSNLQIPMVERLDNRYKDSEGWITTLNPDMKGLVAAAVDALDFKLDFPQISYSSLLGIPITRGGTSKETAANSSSDSTEAKIDNIKQDLFGPDIVSTESLFNFQTSYLYANCTVGKAVAKPSVVDYSLVVNASKTSWNSSVGETVTNGNGLTIAYESTHNVNSTRARRLGLESWLGIDGTVRNTWNVDLSEAWCNLTTTYVEVQAFCTNELNCTVSKLRRSQAPHPDPIFTVFDGIQTSDFQSPNEYSDQTLADYDADSTSYWFSYFVNSTSSSMHGPHDQVPLEAYFNDPVTPHYYALNGNKENPYPQPIRDVSDELFSTRLTQLLNTYWLASVAPYTIVAGVDYYPDPNDPNAIANARNDGVLGTSKGNLYVETMVLRCHKAYLAILLTVSTLLFASGLATAYLDATRKGPDVLDDFVNSLRHSPYVHVEQGPSMEDGQEKARRLRQTVIQMGDVSPTADHGYVAIGTPSAEQAVERLTHKRLYK